MPNEENSDKSETPNYKEIEKEFIDNLSNPRRINAVCNWYHRYEQRIEEKKRDYSKEKLELIKTHLGKIEYEKQLAILSIVYGLYLEEFLLLESLGIDRYINNNSLNNDAMLVRIIVRNYWMDFNPYMQAETRKFVDWLLSGDYDLAVIANIFTTEDDSHLNAIGEGRKPGNLSFYGTILLISRSTKQAKKRRELLERAFELFFSCLNGNVVGEVDGAFEIFEQDLESTQLKYAAPIMELFASKICNVDCYLQNNAKMKKTFQDFFSSSLNNQLMYIYNYFHAILPRNDSSASEFDSLFMSYMRIDDCDEKIIMFCDRIEKRFECSNDEKNNDKVERLKKLICFVSSKYEKEGVSGRLDVKMDKEGVDILMFEIESMYKIKEFLNTKNISKESYHVNKHFPIEKLPSAINYYSDHKATLEIGELTKGVNDILSYICDNECEITSADYDKLEAITAWRCEQVGSTNGAYWRQDLIYIKNNLIKSLNKDYGEFQRSLKPKE